MTGGALLVATAGHVDHGKSTLVRFLTGTDPDRLEEEKRRGLTIDLGFAWCELPSGVGLSFVDVPGHARFLKTMLAGVGAVRACLFVVSAVEGWKEQSEEHARILDLLGVAHGVVALTRSASVPPARVEAVAAEVRAATAGTFLAGAPAVPVDVPAGLGTDTLVAALESLATRMVGPHPGENRSGRLPDIGTPLRPQEDSRPGAGGGRARLWVDRCFTVAGAGTVVTGTLTGGSLAAGDAVEVLSGGRSRAARVRGVQVHGRSVDRTGPGGRTALNLAGVERRWVARGAVVVEPGRWHVATRFDASVTVLAGPGAAAVRSGRGALLLYLGTSEQAVRVRVIGGGTIPAGGSGHARVHLSVPAPLLPGDRFVLRDSGRSVTIGGGVVLDVDPVLPTTRAHPDLSVERVVAERGWVEVDAVERLTGRRVPATVTGWVASPDALAADRARLRDAVETAGPSGLALDTLPPRDRALLAELVPGVTVAHGRALRIDSTGRDPADAGTGPEPTSPYLRTLRADLFHPPTPREAGCSPAELQDLRSRGLVVHRDGVYFATEALEAATATVRTLLRARPEGVTTGEIRAALGTTRRWALPLVELLDHHGVTRRHGDLRHLVDRGADPAHT